MKYLIFLLLIVTSCGISRQTTATEPNPVDLQIILDKVNWAEVESQLSIDQASLRAGDRDCSKDGRADRKASTTDVVTGTGLEIVTYRNAKGYWHNPPNDYARTFYQDGVPFIWVSYDNQVSTDVVSGGIRYASSIRLMPDGKIREVHKRNTWETTIAEKIKGQEFITYAVYWYYPDGTLECIGDYDCDRYVSGCYVYR